MNVDSQRSRNDGATPSSPRQPILVRNFLDDVIEQPSLDNRDVASPLVDYQQAWQAMKQFTATRSTQTQDEVWLLEHPPVFTLGQAADRAHLLNAHDIPVITIDRGGQVTYHGPGQIMMYVLLDLGRLQLGVRALVEALEQSIIATLADYGLAAKGDRAAPGVYVEGAKIAALGLRVSRRCSYHGLCFNFAFDSRPFAYINPCGDPSMRVTQLAELIEVLPSKRVFSTQLAHRLAQFLACDTEMPPPQAWRSFWRDDCSDHQQPLMTQ